MTTNTFIPAFLAEANVDAVAWSEARDGDYLLLRDPASRALTLADAFRIDGVVSFGVHGKGTMTCYTVRVQGNEAYSWSFRKPANRIFNSASWQVWRDFGANP